MQLNDVCAHITAGPHGMAQESLAESAAARKGESQQAESQI